MRRAKLFLALLGFLLAAVGVYGVVTYSVTRRTAEIGIRMALGADPSSTFQDVVRSALGVVAVGVVVGCVAAAILGRSLQSMLFGVSSIDPVTYVSAAVVLAVVGLCAAAVPALRASRIDPVRALRQD